MFTSYALQYTLVDVATVQASGVDLFITEGGTGPGFSGAALDTAGLAALQTGGTSVLAYVNLSVTDDNRSYWNPDWTDDGTDTGAPTLSAPAWLTGQPSNSFGYIVDYSDPAWQAIVIQQAVDYVTAGYDGVFLDDLAQYFVAGATGLGIAQQAEVMMDFVTTLTAAIEAVNPAAQVVVNGSPYIVTDAASGSAGASSTAFLAAIDAMLFESYFGINSSEEAAIAHAQTYVAPHTQVLALEYGGTEFQNWAFYGMAMAGGFVPFAAGDASYSSFGTVTGPTSGDDNVIGLNISQSIYLMAGNDTVDLGAGNDTVLGNYGNDFITAADGNDLIKGGAGDDAIWGENGNDTLRGDDGNDYIAGGYGNDLIRGGVGNDVLEGLDQEDLIFGDDGNDSIIGGYGHDTVYGGTGNDTINGLYHNDLILGEDGDDSLDGHEGTDTVLGGAGMDTMFGGLHDDRMRGDDGDDSMNGGRDDDVLRGGLGNDTLWGGYGNDTLYGDDGNDLIMGIGTGASYFASGDRALMYGGDGDDTLVGGIELDVMEGNAGADTFRFSTGTNRNIIRDFEFGTDTLELDAALWSDAGVLTAQQVADTYGGYSPNGANFLLSFDTATVILIGVTGLSTTDIAADFLIA